MSRRHHPLWGYVLAHPEDMSDHAVCTIGVKQVAALLGSKSDEGHKINYCNHLTPWLHSELFCQKQKFTKLRFSNTMKTKLFLGTIHILRNQYFNLLGPHPTSL